MKRKSVSVLLILLLVMTLFSARGGKSSGSIRCRVLSDSDNHAHFIRSKREILLFRSEPVLESGKAGAGFKYYKGIMDDGRTGGYMWGNCTWWAYSRASEVLGELRSILNLRGNAGEWWDCNKKGKFYPYGFISKSGLHCCI